MVNNNRLVLTYTKILNILYNKNLSVNDIIKQTSSDRTFVINALKELEKVDFINTLQSKSHRQKKVKQLTKLGYELAHLTFNIENFNSAYFKLDKIIDEYEEIDKKVEEYKERNKKQKNNDKKTEKNQPLPMSNKTTFRIDKVKDSNLKRFLKEKLKEKRWTDTEIRYYRGCRVGLYFIDILLPAGIITILLQKFLSFLTNFDLNVGTREIINRIIIEIFQIQLSNIVTHTRMLVTKYLMEHQHKNDKIDYSGYYPSFKSESFDYIDSLVFPFSLAVMGIIEELMTCYLNLLKPSKEIIEHSIESMKKDIENASDGKIDDGNMNREELRMRSRCLINAYEKYLKSN